MIKRPSFRYRGHWIDAWSGSSDSTCCVANRERISWCKRRAVSISPGPGAQGISGAKRAPPLGAASSCGGHRLSHFSLTLPPSGCFFPGTHPAPSFTSLRPAPRLCYLQRSALTALCILSPRPGPHPPLAQKTQEYNMSHRCKPHR